MNRRQKWILANLEKHRESQAKYRKKNAEARRLKLKEWRKENPELVKVHTKNAIEKHREKRNARASENRKAKRSQYLEREARYRILNEEKRRAYEVWQVETVSDAYLAKAKGMSVEHLREYPRPVIDLWKTLLKLSRIQKQINTEINEIEKRNDPHE